MRREYNTKNVFPFTVNSSGKKVVFSPANLYWDGSAYKFEANEYDCPTTWDTSHVGHFYWSKDVSVAMARNYSDDSASTSDTFFASSGITVNGYSETWTVLSSDEWNYVISNHLGKYRVSISDKNCAVLVPDGVDASDVQSSYTAEQWADAKEQYGLVALPFAGTRSGARIIGGSGFNTSGNYWTGTPESSSSIYAQEVVFEQSDTRINTTCFRSSGDSVRLVSVL